MVWYDVPIFPPPPPLPCLGRLTGAGWGGCAVALVAESQVESFIKLLQDAFYSKRVRAIHTHTRTHTHIHTHTHTLLTAARVYPHACLRVW